jgi:pyruvate,water dikinase
MLTSVYPFDKLAEAGWPLAGGKGGTLSQLYQSGYPVPEGFVILPDAFDADALTNGAWEQVKSLLDQIRTTGSAFAVRSSALSEDSLQASFAGEFETVLDVHSDGEVRAAIKTVRLSRHSERVAIYSRARGVDAGSADEAPEMAVVVQRLIRADISGVLFTADPVSGSHNRMRCNYLYGFGEGLVSGEAVPNSFTLRRRDGEYRGPADMQRYSRKLYRLADRLEKQLGCPQDIEWAIAQGKLYLLQSRPITTLRGYDPLTGDWNASQMGDYLWSNANLTEAVPDVMTPFTWSVWEVFHKATAFTSGKYPITGNICGRPYSNISVFLSIYTALGRDPEEALEEAAGAYGRVPEGIEIPLLPMTRCEFIRYLILNIIPRLRKARQVNRNMPDFIEQTPGWCRQKCRCIRAVSENDALLSLWREEIYPYFIKASWMVRVSGIQAVNFINPLTRDLNEMVGYADANALLSYLRGDAELESLGPLVGISQLADGDLSRAEYLERYGHRGPHEMELSMPRPEEDPEWLDQQLDEMKKYPVDVNSLLDKQRDEYLAAWNRLEQRYPGKKKSIGRRIDEAASRARGRETVRSEFTRVAGVLREFALRAGKLTGLHDNIFFLTCEELLDVLAGKRAITATIPARRETYEKYKALPFYPTFISGRFDPFQWAADPQRRSDYYDSHAAAPIPAGETITGFAGAAGRVEGKVRCLARVEDGGLLQPGEILVTTTTNVGWTPLFLRAAAIVTDVGAPLSHAAIVARELGIPAVVGCGDATMRLETGDRVRVDGGRGVVEKIGAER